MAHPRPEKKSPVAPTSHIAAVQTRNGNSVKIKPIEMSERAKAHYEHRRALQSNDLMRFSVAMPENLLMDFDELVAHRGISKNRSEVIRDLVREALIESRSSIPGTVVMGTLTIVYNHHSSDLQDKLHAIQHEYFENIVSTLHVHIDSDTCLEVIVIRGETTLVQNVSNMILGTKGVQTGKLTCCAIIQ